LDIDAVTRASPMPPANRAAWSDRVLAYRLLWMLAVGVFILDQLTKTWVILRIDYVAHPTEWPHAGSISVIEGFFHLVHVGNTGAAWSLFAGKSSLLALLAGITLLGIFYWRKHLGLRERRVQIAFGLLIGGIVGNFLDRIRHGHVIDFIDLHFGGYVYPTFNIADSGICVGVLLYLWHSFKEPKETPPAE
jgi:signal peptidase II